MNDFTITQCHHARPGTLYAVTPTNTAALCWMLAHTTRDQRRAHTIAILTPEELAVFSADSQTEGYTVAETAPTPSPQQNRITLTPGQPVTAKFTGPHAAQVIELFNTDTLPCPWDSRQPRADILAAIQRQNPDALVQWESEQP